MLNIWCAFQREKSKRKVKCLQIYNDRDIGYNVEIKRQKKRAKITQIPKPKTTEFEIILLICSALQHVTGIKKTRHVSKLIF